MEYECHGHLILDGINYKNAVAMHSAGPVEAFVREQLSMLRKHDILFYRDGGDKNGVSLLAKKLAAEYGIDYRTPGFAIYPKGHYGGMFGFSFSTIAECEELILQAKKLGADYIKLMLSGIMDFNEYRQISGGIVEHSVMQSAVQIAHREGLAVMAHVNTAEAIKNAILSGVDSVEHGYYADSECLDLFSAYQCIWVPTLSPVDAVLQHGLGDNNVLNRILSEHRQAIQEALKNDVLIACGSDAGSFGVMPDGCLKEKELLLNAVPPEMKIQMKKTLERSAKAIMERFR